MNLHIPILMFSAYLPLPSNAIALVDASLTKGEPPMQLFEQVRVLLNKPYSRTA